MHLRDRLGSLSSSDRWGLLAFAAIVTGVLALFIGRPFGLPFRSRCDRLYAEARTRADSAVVDALPSAPGLRGGRNSCAELRSQRAPGR